MSTTLNNLNKQFFNDNTKSVLSGCDPAYQTDIYDFLESKSKTFDLNNIEIPFDINRKNSFSTRCKRPSSYRRVCLKA